MLKVQLVNRGLTAHNGAFIKLIEIDDARCRALGIEKCNVAEAGIQNGARLD
jgi:hypothetical protein